MIRRTRPAGRKFLLVSTAAIALALGAPLMAGAPAKAGQPKAAIQAGPVAPKGAPNVLLIMTDDVGFAASSTFGGPVPTPTFDALAANGLRYNQFHTTALCSPTRAALLTGRNSHSVGSGVITELATPQDGYSSVIPKSAATIGQVLRDNGYSTSWFGKNHNTPDWETGPSGPFDRWPTGLGFEYFYGFNAGDTDQWAPALVENTTMVEPPTQNPSYILDKDLADHAIDWLHQQHATQPDKPFLMYFAPGTAHAPHQAPKAWIERFKGRFDQGWDKMREESFARQKAAGVIPADTVLTPRPKEIPAWDSLTQQQQHLYAHMMEVYAAALAYSDDQIGRVMANLAASGQLQNTIVIYIQGDNGASGEGGLQGTTNEMVKFNGLSESFDFLQSQYDALGGPTTFNHYPVGWAWAMNTPFQWTKQIASHFGGIRNGMVLSWPGHIQDPGHVRSQFSHVIDIAPTLYDAIGIKPPATVGGVKQQPLEGQSLLATLTPATPATPRTQYFEMFGNRAIYQNGWIASTTPKRVPWVFSADGADPETLKWELYHVDQDFSQAHDLAAADPKRLAALKVLFNREAKAHHVLPLNGNVASRFSMALRPYPLNGKTDLTFYPGAERYSNGSFPDIKNRSWTVTAKLDAAGPTTEGVVVTQGGFFNGWGLIVRGGRPVFIYRASNQPADVTSVEAPEALSPGPHEVTVDFDYDGGGPGRGGAVSLKIDGVHVASGRLPRTVAASFSLEGAAVGHDTGTALADYRLPFNFSGSIESVNFKLR